MELRQLNYFIHLAETLNFSLAAKELFITQSTLSHQILQLEHYLGQPLFIRNSHEVTLTEAGQTLLPLARETIHSADNCVLRLNELKNLMSGDLKIGVTFSFASIMAETLTMFLRRYPNVKVNVSQSTMADLMERLIRHELDFVLAFKPTESDPRVESTVIFHHRLAAIVNEHHALASHKHISLDELQQYDLALPRKGTQARSAFDRLISNYDYHYRVKVEMNTVYLLFRLARESNYVTVLSESTVLGEQGLTAVPITLSKETTGNNKSSQTESQGYIMHGCIHNIRNTYMKNSAKEFIRMLGENTLPTHLL